MQPSRRSAGARMLTFFFVAAVVLAVGATTGSATTSATAPQNTRPPAVSGEAREGQLLRADTGVWRRDTARRAVFEFQWTTCSSAGTGCVPVANATGSTYAVRHDDIGHRLAVTVTAVTPDGTSASASSVATAAVGPAVSGAPIATQRPTLGGAAVVGATLTATSGTWTGTEPTQLAYRWRSCPARGGNCHDLAGTGATIVLKRSEVGQVLRVRVSATNAVGVSVSSSDPTAIVGVTTPQSVPKVTTAPAISGTPRVGQRLRASRGTWTGTIPMRFFYRWLRCPGSGNVNASDCATIDRSTGARYLVQRADEGARLLVAVVARNAVGWTTSTSAPTAVVTPAAPAAVAPRAAARPVVNGTLRAGNTLTATSGSWTGTKPFAFAYRWVRCDRGGGAPDGSNCASISGADESTYRLATSDVGSRLRVRVTASNRAGSATAASEPTTLVGPAGPAVPVTPHNTREPSLAGTPVQGQTLTANPGSWTGAGTIKLSYQWVRCGANGGQPDGSNCANIGGATTTKYVVAAGDVGSRLRVRVTARSPYGQQTAASNATAAVTPLASGPPRERTEPAIAGAPAQGQTLTATGGSWLGATPITLAFQWVRCGADGGRADGSNCAVIPRASAAKYVPQAADVGSRLRVRVTARNGKGAATAASNATVRITTANPELPPGAVRLPDGKYSIPVTSVSLPTRLVINKAAFTPNPVRSRRTTLRLRVRIFDTRGYVVRDALVFARSTPLVTSPAGEPRTATDGWATLRMVPKASFPIRAGYNVQFFIRVRKPGDSLLAGVSSRRLVQVRTAG